MILLSDKTFGVNLKASAPMIVLFEAAWAGPCNLVRPKFTALESEYPRIQFARFDIDDNVETPQSYNVRGVPMFITFGADCVPVGMKQGDIPAEAIREMLDELGGN